MAEASSLRGTALALGIIAVLMIGGGVAFALLSPPAAGTGPEGLLVRVGALLGAVALILPTVRRPSLSTIVIAVAGLTLVLARPGLVWAALIGWSAWALIGRQRRTSSRDS